MLTINDLVIAGFSQRQIINLCELRMRVDDGEFANDLSDNGLSLDEYRALQFYRFLRERRRVWHGHRTDN